MSKSDGKRIRLGELLLRAGVITDDQLRRALAEQRQWGGKLGSILVEMNFLSEDLLVKALSRQLDLPRVDFGRVEVSRWALKKLKADFAESRQVLPISLDRARGQLIVAMADPEDLALIDEIAFRTSCTVKSAIAGGRALSRAIRKHYFGEQQVDRAGADSPGFSLDRFESMDRTTEPGPVSERIPKQNDDPWSPKTGTGSSDLLERLNRLEALQRKEVLVLKTILEMLIEKGFLSRSEYRRSFEQ